MEQPRRSRSPRSGVRIWVIVALLLSLPMAMSLFGNGQGDDLVAWEADYEMDLARAAASDKDVLLVFTNKWCPPCREMTRRVYARRDVADLINSRLVPIKIDLTDMDAATQELAGRYGVIYLPTLVLLDGDQHERRRVVGFRDEKQLLAWLGVAKTD